MPIHHLPHGFERRHVFADPAAHPDHRESLAYLLPLPELGLGVIYYTWVHALGQDGKGRAGSLMVAYGPALPEPIFEVKDGLFVPDAMTFADWQVGPAHMTLADDMASGRLGFTADQLSLDVGWDALNPSFGFLANRNGCPSWLARDRTEQGVHFRGRLTVAGREIAVDASGHRDHSWGNRDWGGPTHWKWWNVLGPKRTAIPAMELQAFGKTPLPGYVQKDGVIATLLSLEAEMTFDDRFMHTAIDATLVDDEGRTTRVQTWRGADLVWPVSDFLTLHEASMFASIDGAPGVGYMEVAWPPAYAEHHRKGSAAIPRNTAGLTIDKA